jgi:Holliday junction resolvasome RuvABC ATP-dependent DNA helicase subunit
MYLYLSTATGQPVALMPSNRGKVARNHALQDIRGVEISINFIDADKVAELKTAAAVKHLVTTSEPGSLTTMTDPVAAAAKFARSTGGPADLGKRAEEFVLTRAAVTMSAVFAEDGRHPEIVKQLADAILAIAPALGTSAPFDAFGEATDDNLNAVAALIKKLRRPLNNIMNERRYGWFHAGYDGIEIPPAPAAEDVDDEPEAADTNEYGFAKFSGGRPELGVVGADEAPVAEEHGVFYPKPDATYIISNSIENLFKILETSSKRSPQNVRLIGPHGCGKTELAIQFAARNKRPLLIMDCANLREARDWFGYKSAKDGTVFWNESQFVRAVEAGNHVILLDELNRANPNLLNTLMPILDDRRFTYLEERGEKIVVGPGTVFFASMNEGASYTGTSTLDRAIRDRFPRHVELTYLGEKDETQLLQRRTGINKDIASRLVQTANKIRQDSTGLTAQLTESLSTRQLLAAAHDFALGGVDTLTFTIINHFSPEGDDESERAKVQSLIQGKFGDLMAAAAAASKGA